MASKKKLLQAAAGSAGGAGLDVDEVFSTFLYDGTGSNQTITNGIDLSGEGGLTWIKGRMAGGFSHYLFDTERGVTKYIRSNEINAEGTDSNTLTAFNSNGFTVGSANATNYNTGDFVSWTFRKAPKFFDVVTWTGSNFGGGRQISHNLGSVPGIIIIKRTSAASAWYTWHRSTPNSYYTLDSTDEGVTDSTKYYFGDGTNVVAPTSTEFTTQTMNENGFTYVAYLFAHNNNDGEFGPDSDQDIIKCGSYTGNGSTTGPVIDLGFEPQFLMIKNASTSSDWTILDTMRGLNYNVNYDPFLRPNLNNAEAAAFDCANPLATGFQLKATSVMFNTNNDTFIYMAIRRGPLAAPEDATKVFAINTTGTNDSPNNNFTAGLVPDMNINTQTSGNDNYVLSRLLGNGFLSANSTAVFSTNATASYFDGPTGTIDLNTAFYGTASNVISWSWKRAPSYFDVVAYSGTGSARTVSHNLGVPPEMIWVKKRDGSQAWQVYHSATGNNQTLQLNTDAAAASSTKFNSTDPTSSVFSLSNASAVNGSGTNYIAYLFATVAGVSKVGSYTGNAGASTINVDCGFSSGARFVLIKESSGTGDWWVFDTVRGLVAGNDAALKLNTTDAESSFDYIDPYSGGFSLQTNSGINTNNATFIFYAIA